MNWSERLKKVEKAYIIIKSLRDDIMIEEPSIETIVFAVYLGIITMLLEHVKDCGVPTSTTPMPKVN